MTDCSIKPASGGRAELLRTTWNRRRGTWHKHVFDSPVFEEVRAAVIEASHLTGAERVVDLGAGGGFLALAVAPLCSSVVAVDISDGMLDELRDAARDKGITNVEVRVADLADFDLPAASVDVVVSNYALHHLTDADKSALLARAHEWLKPGGRLVIADMMFGRGGSRRDRRILLGKVVVLARKGPGGAWRIVKNLVRFGLRRGTELPAPPEFWTGTARSAGFRYVAYRAIANEAGLVTAVSGRDRRDLPVPAE